MDHYERWQTFRDALRCVEMAKPYRDGEQWAVTTAINLRRLTAEELKIAAAERSINMGEAI